MEALVYFTVANIAAIYAATTWARNWNQDGPLDRTIVYATLNWLLIVHASMLGCGVLGLLRPEWVTGVVVFAAATIWAITRHAGREKHTVDRSRINLQPIEYLLVSCMMTASVVWLKLVIWDPFDTVIYDDQTYKALYPTLWMRDGLISLKHVFGGMILLFSAVFVLHPTKSAATYRNQTAGVFHVLEEQPDGLRLWAYSPMGNTWILSLFLTFKIPLKEGVRWPVQHPLSATSGGAVLPASDDKFALWKIDPSSENDACLTL